MTRRALVVSGAALLAAADVMRPLSAAEGAISTTPGHSTSSSLGPSKINPAVTDDLAAAKVDLDVPSALGDMTLGKADAPVSIVEYASLTCPHCAAFEAEVFSKIKTAYIDTGKVRWTFRDFPLDVKAAGATMLLHCVAKDDAVKFYDGLEALFKTQLTWAMQADTVAELGKFGAEHGLSGEQFKACLSDQDEMNKLKETQNHAYTKLKVDATPYFFINGVRIKGGRAFEDFEKLIKTAMAS